MHSLRVTPARLIEYKGLEGALLDTHDHDGSGYTSEQRRRLRSIHARIIEARRELDSLIGDAYLRPRASIVPVHFLDLASAVEKLRWAEKEWRELDREVAESRGLRAGDFDDLMADEPLKSSAH